MWGTLFKVLVRALGWASTASVGWVVSDVYNESATNTQITAASLGQATITSAKKRWPMFVILVILFIVVMWVLNKFNFFKLFKK
jgi:t-SNARE complex subunit (syntaxin)